MAKPKPKTGRKFKSNVVVDAGNTPKPIPTPAAVSPPTIGRNLKGIRGLGMAGRRGWSLIN